IVSSQLSRVRARGQFGQIRTLEVRNSARLRQPACKAANAVTRNAVRFTAKCRKFAQCKKRVRLPYALPPFSSKDPKRWTSFLTRFCDTRRCRLPGLKEKSRLAL